MVISIYKFLQRYYGEFYDDRKKLTHKSAKSKFNLRGCSFDYAKQHDKMVGTGKIIYVRDSVGVVLPYYCPEIIANCSVSYDRDDSKKESDIDLVEILKQIKQSGEKCTYKNILDELSELSTRDVKKLLKKYKYNPYFYRVIKMELINRREYEKKKYKLKKKLLELEEGGVNDKYQRRRKIEYEKP